MVDGARAVARVWGTLVALGAAGLVGSAARLAAQGAAVAPAVPARSLGATATGEVAPGGAPAVTTPAVVTPAVATPAVRPAAARPGSPSVGPDAPPNVPPNGASAAPNAPSTAASVSAPGGAPGMVPGAVPAGAPSAVPNAPADDRLAYAGYDRRGVPRYVRRVFTPYERALLRWAFGIEEPNRMWLADSTPDATLRYDTRLRDGRVTVARLGYPSARRPGETWDAFHDRIARSAAQPWGPQARVTYASVEALAPDAREPFRRLLDDARRAGFRVQVRESYRTPERQAMLYAMGDGRTFTPTSSHMVGRAIDVVIGDGRLGGATQREWIAFRRWVLAQQGGRFRLIGTPERTWDWPHVELADDPEGFRTVSALLAAARRCAGHPDPDPPTPRTHPALFNPRLLDGAAARPTDAGEAEVPRAMLGSLACPAAGLAPAR